MSRRSIVLSALIGLLGAVVLTALCLFVMAKGWIPVLITNPIFLWAIFLFLVFFSVAEIPVMVFAIRRIADSANPKAKYVALLANVGYTFFGAVYAVPFIFLTGRLGLGAAMAALCFVRFLSVVIFIPR